TRPAGGRLRMKPPPPRFPALGSVTASAKPTATAASTALPPPRRIFAPTSEASALEETTIPLRAPTGVRAGTEAGRTTSAASARAARFTGAEPLFRGCRAARDGVLLGRVDREDQGELGDHEDILNLRVHMADIGACLSSRELDVRHDEPRQTEAVHHPHIDQVDDETADVLRVQLQDQSLELVGLVPSHQVPVRLEDDDRAAQALDVGVLGCLDLTHTAPWNPLRFELQRRGIDRDLLARVGD